uniref:Small-subunit processome Utp12 domain-containing protein n=1 Tax=Ciona savignyi TaxID=51511 RepID=H2YNV0_CIOSA
MKFNYKFSNLVGTVYRKGNVTFINNGDSLVSPVGNRISLFDLKSNKSETLPVTTKYNIVCVAVSPDGCTAILVDEEGEASLISFISKSVLHTHHFRKPIKCIKFSPDGSKFAVTKDNLVLVYHAPGRNRELNPFKLIRTFYGAYNDTTCIDWTSDSRAFAVGGLDMNTRVYAAIKCDNLVVYSLGAHKDEIVGCFFELNSLDIYTTSRDGALNVWECDTPLEGLKLAQSDKVIPYTEEVQEEDVDAVGTKEKEDLDESETKKPKILYKRVAKLVHFSYMTYISVCAECTPYSNIHSPQILLQQGRRFQPRHQHSLPPQDSHPGDRFGIRIVPHPRCPSSISSILSGSKSWKSVCDYLQLVVGDIADISEHQITASAFNVTGDWLALGSSGLGQLLVWEWQSESYILKQQGHSNGMCCLDYSPDGRFIVTGGEDGKVKVWNTSNGFCFVTFSEHESTVTAVRFTSSGHVIMSSSLDGTVRAFDLHRYRNFRTFTSPRPSQFVCMGVDGSGELVAAGSRDSFEVFVWSVRTGRLLDVLAGHEAPVSSLQFSPCESLLASGSWDRTVILWKIGDEKGARESIDVGHDGWCSMFSSVMAVTYRGDGKELAVSTLNAEITFWDVKTATQNGSVDCRFDIGCGRGELDRVSAKTSSFGKSFDALCYTADGSAIIAGGQTKNVCVYHVENKLLMKKFEISSNFSFDGMEEFLDKRKMTEFGPSALIDMDTDEKIKLPGVRVGDMGARAFHDEVRVSGVCFSPTGREWAAVSTEGLLIYSLDANLVFDPFNLDMDITPESIRDASQRKEYSGSIMMSFRLNDKPLIREVLEAVPSSSIELLCERLPPSYVDKLLDFLASEMESSPHLHFILLWMRAILTKHGPHLKSKSNHVVAVMRHVQKSLTRKSETICKL